MAKRNFCMGMLVMVLVFGITVVGCDNGNGGFNFLDSFNLSTEAPSPAALAAGGVTQTQFNQIRDAAAGGFYGWAIDEGELIMAWTGRSIANFNNTADAFDSVFNEFYRDEEADHEGIYWAMGDNYVLMLFSKNLSSEGYYASAGNMIAFLGDSWGASFNRNDILQLRLLAEK